MKTFLEAQGEKTGHFLALFTILIWSTTFLSSTVLLRDFSPVEVLFFRCSLAILALLIVSPKRLKLKKAAHEWYFVGAGLCGVTLYFLFENLALTYTYSGNCSVIVSTAPFFVAIASRLFLKDEKLSPSFFVGFVAAMAGICLLSFSGRALQINPLGDALCVLAAICWALYSVFIRKIELQGYPTLLSTRRVFEYGLLFLLPCMALFGFAPKIENLLKPINLFNFLYLGLGASALCFVTWNTAAGLLGAIKTSVYIYVSPALTIVAAWLLLGDPILPMALLGAALTLAGLLISQKDSLKALLAKRRA